MKELICCTALILTSLEMAAGKSNGTQSSAMLAVVPSSTILEDSPTPTGAFLTTSLQISVIPILHSEHAAALKVPLAVRCTLKAGISAHQDGAVLHACWVAYALLTVSASVSQCLLSCRFMFVISNTRHPVAGVSLRYPDGSFHSLSRGWNDMWAANGGPFTFPITIQACSFSFPAAAAGVAVSCAEPLAAAE